MEAFQALPRNNRHTQSRDPLYIDSNLWRASQIDKVSMMSVTRWFHAVRTYLQTETDDNPELLAVGTTITHLGV